MVPVPNLLARESAFSASWRDSAAVMPKRAARAARLVSSLETVVVGRLAFRGGVSVAIGVSVVVVAVSSVVFVGGWSAGRTVKSEVLDGSVDGIWFGTAVGLGG